MFNFLCKTSDGLLKFFIKSNGETVLSFFLWVQHTGLSLWLNCKFMMSTWTFL